MGIYFLLIICLEIKFIIKGVKEKNKNNFKIYNGLFFSSFVTIMLYYFYFTSDIYSFDTGEWIWLKAFFQSLIFSIISLIIALVSLYFQIKTKKKQYNDTSKKCITIKTFLLASLISLIFIFSQYFIRYNEKVTIDNEVRKETMLYLDKRYGTNDFKIVDIDRSFAEHGFIGTNYLECYDIQAIYIPDNIKFYINLDVDDERKILKDSFDDTLTSKIYIKYFIEDDFKKDNSKEQESLLKYLKSNQLNVDISSNQQYSYDLIADEVLPNNYGKIPSKEELYYLILDYYQKHEYKITINKDEIKSDDIESELRKYLIKLSNHLIAYYGNLNDYEIWIEYNAESGKTFSGTINITEEYINIAVDSIKEQIKRKK